MNFEAVQLDDLDEGDQVSVIFAETGQGGQRRTRAWQGRYQGLFRRQAGVIGRSSARWWITLRRTDGTWCALPSRAIVKILRIERATCNGK